MFSFASPTGSQRTAGNGEKTRVPLAYAMSRLHLDNGVGKPKSECVARSENFRSWRQKYQCIPLCDEHDGVRARGDDVSDVDEPALT